MYYDDLKAISPIASNIVTFDAVSAHMASGAGMKAAEYKGLQRLACMKLFPASIGAASISLTPIGDEVDARLHKNGDLVDWNHADLMSEIVRVFQPVTDPKLIKAIEKAFQEELKEAAAEAAHPAPQPVDKAALLPKVRIDAGALADIVALLQPEAEQAQATIAALTQAAQEPAAYLKSSGRLSDMSEAACKAYRWQTEIYEGSLFEAGRIHALDWKAETEDLAYVIEQLCGAALTLSASTAEGVEPALAEAGKALLSDGRALIEFASDSDSHFITILPDGNADKLQKRLKSLGLKSTWHGQKRRGLFGRRG